MYLWKSGSWSPYKTLMKDSYNQSHCSIISSSNLVPSANIIWVPVPEHAAGDLITLRLQGHQHVAGLVVKACTSWLDVTHLSADVSLDQSQYQLPLYGTFWRVVITNRLDGIPDHWLEIHGGLGRDLSNQHDHARLRHTLCGENRSITEAYCVHLAN